MARLMIRILLHLRNSETIGRPRGFAYQVARNDLPQYVVPIPMLVRAAIFTAAVCGFDK